MNDAARIVDALLETDDLDPKSFVAARDASIPQYHPLLIHGSYGTLKIDPNDGTILEYMDAPEDPDEGDYSDIVKFDLPELARWIKAHGSPEWRSRADEVVGPGSELDIVDVSFWTHDGEYVPGEEEHRMISWNDHQP